MLPDLPPDTYLNGGLVAVLPAASQSYPTRPITLIVPFAAGGFNDVIVRIVGDHMAKTLGQDDQATAKRLLDIGCFLPEKPDRTPQALQERVEREMARWSSVLKRE